MDAPKASVAVAEALDGNLYPTFDCDMQEQVILGANAAAYDLLGWPPNSLAGIPLTDVLGRADGQAVRSTIALLASGAIDGYRATRHFRKPDGSEFTANVWVRRTPVAGKQVLVASLQPDKQAGLRWLYSDTGVTIVLVVTDHDWMIEHISSDVEAVLGVSPETYEGVSLLGLLQPADVQNFMLAVTRVEADGGGATLRVHLRNGKGHRQDATASW